MDLPNADILELKEMMRGLFSIVQGLALGQKAMAERLERIESWLIYGSQSRLISANSSGSAASSA